MVTLVPVLVVAAILVPCLIYLLRHRRHRRVRFMSTYEDLTRHEPSDMEYVRRRPYTDAGTSGRDSESQYDVGSIPSASMVHLDMVQRRASYATAASSNSIRPQSQSRLSPVDDPFADNSYYSSDASSLLVGQQGRANGGARSPSSVGGSRPPSRWGALSPTPTFPGPSPKRGAFSPVPTDTQSRRGSRPLTWHNYPTVESHQEESVDLTSPLEWADMEDPFANPNKRSTAD